MLHFYFISNCDYVTKHMQLPTDAWICYRSKCNVLQMLHKP